MKLSGVTGIILLLMASMLIITFNVASASSDIIKVPENYLTIQKAIDAANPGDIIVVSEGTYSEGQINVNKPLTLIANGLAIVDGLKKGHVIYVTANNVTIKGFIVKNSKRGWGYSGIRLQGVQNCMVSENTLTNNTNGIGIGGLGYNVIRENNATNNAVGIGLYGARNKMIEGNILRNNNVGIRLYRSHENSIRGNVAIDNGILPGELGLGIYLEGSSRNLIEANILRNNRWTGILLYGVGLGSHWNVIRKNTISLSYNGIYLWWSENNSVCENEIDLTSWAGLKLRPRSKNNKVIGNTVRNMYGSGPGIFVDTGSNSNMLIGNLISNVTQWVYSNNAFGNLLYHNSFVNLRPNPYGIPKISIVNSTSIWDNNYPSGGNYWDDYEGSDDYTGPHQNETGSDGIVDIPYVINEDNRDRYPLTEPWEPPAMMRFLIRTICSWYLSKGTENNLVKKIEEAIHLLDIGNENGAIRKLGDFMNLVEAMRDKKLTEEQADYLILEAQRIIDLIGG